MEWRKNLYHFEEQPPEQAWELISKELEEDIPALRNKLFDVTAVPPPEVWHAVASEINGEETNPVQAPVIWYKKSWNIAAAAVFAAVLFGVVYLNSNKIDPAGMSTAVINPVPSSKNDPAPAPQKDPVSIFQNDNNYIYFTSANGETKRLSYKLKPLLPALTKREHHVLLDKWSNTIENSAFIPSGNNFFDIVEMLRMVEQKN